MIDAFPSSERSVEGEETTPSISSLRSRFESLSAGEPKPPILSARRPVTPTPRSPNPEHTGAHNVLSRSLRPPNSPTPSANNGSPQLTVPHFRSPSQNPSAQTSPNLPAESTRVPTNPIRRAAPSIPRKNSSVSSTPYGSDDGVNEEEDRPIASVKALRERFSAPPNAVAGSSTPSSVASREIPRQGWQPPPVVDVIPSTPVNSLLNGSAPPIKRTSTGGSITALSPSLPSNLKDDSGMASTQASSSSAMIDGVSPAVRSKPAPTPRSRSTSPVPPPPNRATKPSPRPSPNPSPPSSASGDDSIVLASRSESVSEMIPPPIPARKISITTGDQPLPPPIPGNKPTLSVGMESSRSGESSPIPPRLPQRSRAQTIGKSDAVVIPPRLPVRTSTIGSHNHYASYPSSPNRSREVLSAPAEIYQPPPPPVRNAHVTSSSITSPPRRGASANSGDMSSDDEDDDTTATVGLGITSKKSIEDFPDSTHANRRPPSFVPDIRITTSSTISSFAVYGRHVCLGSHHVRIYDTQMSESPLFVVDLKETELDFRVKEPRVTAMCFRPAADTSDQGRYLWCGTKDGHLWELDLLTGKVTDTRAYAHSSAVVNIFRHHNFLLTLEENGKLNVFEIGQGERGSTIPIICRTVRISDKQTFAKMINGKLWTSSGPSARSTTSASTSKGPTIRIYDPCNPTSSTASKTLFTTEWTGAVTSATILPLHPETVYLGHEGGFVSIWTEEACLQVLKISSSDVLALEGVGERLWAGNRKGHIHVYDITDKPWQTTNIWQAHGEHSVHSLIIDPWSIEHSGRFTLWSCSRESLRAWDGLLSVDWIEKQMVTRQPDYCTFREAKVLVCSWNIDSAKPSDLSGTQENASFLDECLHSVDSPDIVVFGLQEVIPLTDKKLTAKTLFFGSGRNKDSGQITDKVSMAYRQWLDKITYSLQLAMPVDCPYVKVHSESLVGLFSCVFVKASQREMLRDLDITTVKRGIGGIYGNKGAIVARMTMDDTSICFINVHLAAGQSGKTARNADLAAIMEDKAILPEADGLPFVNGGNGTGILDHEMVILSGDLNYRIDQRRENVISNIQAGELAYLLEHDQLRKEIRNNHAFRLRSFDEAPITFKPTYKYTPNSDEYDSSEKRRIPAWCDRILFTKSDRLKATHYRRYEPTVSDHRPISAGFSMQLKAIHGAKMLAVRKEVTALWVKREKELLEMMEDAYGKL